MNKLFFIVFLVSIFPVLSLLTPGVPVTHDGQDHVARIANFYQSLSEGNIVPRWANNLNWGFGHPVLMFLYPLPSYVASFFHLLGFSLVDSVKIVFALAYIVSIIAMYIFVKSEFGEESGVLAAILYGFVPYRFVNIYVRGAIGEHMAFIFLPLILWGMFGLARRKRSIPWGLVFSLSLAGLFLSHNAVSIMVIPIILFFFGYFIFTIQHKRKFAMHVIFFGLYGVGLSAFFLLPAFFEGKYTLRDIVAKGEIYQRMVDPLSFIIPVWNYGGGNEFTKHLGFSIFILFVVSFFVRKKILIFLWVIFFLYVFLMTSPSSFIWERLSMLQKFQFPWRLLVMTTFIGALIGGIVICGLQKQQRIFFLVALSLLSIFSTTHMWRPKAYTVYDESFFTGIYKSTTDTGESSPIWSVRFMEFSPISPMEVAEGKAVVTQVSRTTTSREYMINAEMKTRLVENTLYFPGWEVFVNSRKTDIQFQDPQWRGRITFWVDQGTHTIRILFGDTKVRMISNIISLISIGSLFPLLYLARR